MQYWWDILNTILIFGIFSVSLNLLVGYAGQLSVAQAALGGVGGYTAAYLTLEAGVGFWAGLGAGMAFAGAVGFAVSLPALRLSTDYLILLTVAVSSIVIATVQAVPKLGGAYGLLAPTPASLEPLPGGELLLPGDWTLPLAILGALAFAISWRLGQSPFGRVLRGIREDELATRSLGKNVLRFKATTFAVTAALAGLAGALLFYYNQLAAPEIYGFDVSLTIFAMVIFGGTGNLAGSVLGAAVLVLTRPLLERVVQLSPEQASLWRLAIYGLGLVLLVRLRPRGLLPEGASLRLPWRRGAGEVAGDGALAVRERPAVESRPEAPVLAIRNVSKRYGGIVAVSNLSFELYPHTVTALIGPNGAGKTTVFNLLTGAARTDSGTVTLRGRDVTGLRPDAMARLGVVRSFQDVRAFGRLSALENVAIGAQSQTGETLHGLFLAPRGSLRAERATRAAAMDWLDFVGLAAVAQVPVGALAFGEQKLVALARVLATDADVLLLDEPASGIERRWVERMLELIERVRDQGRTVCIVEHSIEVVDRLADTVCFMELGQVTARGPMRELVTDRRLAEAYFGGA